MAATGVLDTSKGKADEGSGGSVPPKAEVPIDLSGPAAARRAAREAVPRPRRGRQGGRSARLRGLDFRLDGREGLRGRSRPAPRRGDQEADLSPPRSAPDGGGGIPQQPPTRPVEDTPQRRGNPAPGAPPSSGPPPGDRPDPEPGLPDLPEPPEAPEPPELAELPDLPVSPGLPLPIPGGGESHRKPGNGKGHGFGHTRGRGGHRGHD